MTKYTIEQIQDLTGLKYDFLRKCLKHLRDILRPYEERGEFNRLLYNPSGLIVFDKIKQLKEEGLSIPAIKKRLENTDLPTQTTQHQQSQTPPKTDQPQNLLNQFYDLQIIHKQELKEEREKTERANREIREKEETINQLKIQYHSLDSAIKMLPEGKTPEQIRQQWEQEKNKKAEIALLLFELKTLGPLRFIRRKKIFKELEKLTRD